MKVDMNEKVKIKLLKLLELSKRGVGGEKDNAEKMLKILMDKHDVSIEDLDSNVKKKRYYPYTTKEKKVIIQQVCTKVLNSHDVYDIVGYKEVSVSATDYEHIEIIQQIDFHLENYIKERKQFLKDFNNAYVQKHKLYRDPKLDQDEPRELTPEEKRSIWRMSQIKGTLSNNTYTKKLEG